MRIEISMKAFIAHDSVLKSYVLIMRMLQFCHARTKFQVRLILDEERRSML
jgi:hypothetical protein